MPHPVLAAVSAVSVFASAGSALGHPPQAAGGAATETVHVCWPVDETGRLTGTTIHQPIDPVVLEMINPMERSAAGNDNRLDLVFVGDGYTQAELGQYDADVATVVANFFSYEPFIAYEPYFRITKVDVVSAESGVDNDPTEGISRNTALDMSYWCSGIERLLCVNTSKAYSAIAAAGVPDTDQVLAIANSSKYGGAGYPGSNLGTLSGQNGAAVEVAIHEIGHSLGNLADEYTYGGDEVYSGGEPGAANVSIFIAAEQIAQERKWHRWLGERNDPRFDDLIGTFEGGQYSVFGIYRPSNNSMMRSLNRQFNQPSAEALIKEIYREVSPIDMAAPEGTTAIESDTFTITPMQPVGHSLDITWTVNGEPQPSFDGVFSVSATDFALPSGTHTVVARVVDPTDMVRDPAIRDTFLTDTRTWLLDTTCRNAADVNRDGVLDNGDIGAFVALFLGQIPTADFNDDGVLDNGDIGAFVEAFLNGCS